MAKKGRAGFDRLEGVTSVGYTPCTAGQALLNLR